MYFDTASAYGTSESVLGEILPEQHRFKVVTKITPLNLVHNADDLLADGGFDLFGRLQQFKSQGLVKKMGVSVYHTNQVEKILTHYKIDLIKLPINVLNQSFLTGGYLSQLKSHNVEVHVRSVFLQGLLLMDKKQLIEENMVWASKYLDILRNFAQYELVDLKSFALNAVLRKVPHSNVIIGVESAKQLSQNIHNVDTVDIAARNYNLWWKKLHNIPEKLLNPSKWKN